MQRNESYFRYVQETRDFDKNLVNSEILRLPPYTDSLLLLDFDDMPNLKVKGQRSILKKVAEQLPIHFLGLNHLLPQRTALLTKQMLKINAYKGKKRTA